MLWSALPQAEGISYGWSDPAQLRAPSVLSRFEMRAQNPGVDALSLETVDAIGNALGAQLRVVWRRP